MHVDEVEVKKQKAHRAGSLQAMAESAAGGATAHPPATQQCPNVTTTLACLEQGQKRFRLCGSEALHFVLAFLLNNALLKGRLPLFTDGHKGLQNAIKEKYLLRNQGAIPGSALRRQLGLRNAHSPVESAHNALTARCQKHNGMSWSEEGSQMAYSIKSGKFNLREQMSLCDVGDVFTSEA